MSDTPGEGHNGEGVIAGDEVRLLVERYERLEEEKKGIVDDQKDLRAEAKSRGYNPKMILRLVKERAIKKEVRDAERAEWELYLDALGLL